MTDTQIQMEMPDKVLHQIKYLCREIPKVEWSGILFYKIEGSIKDPENMKVILVDILPMNKGTTAYTEYTIDISVIEYMEENEHLEECKMGHIHSHNTMGVFFSGTDWSELEDNAPNHNFYVSLIVNNFMDFCAKVCFISEVKEEKEFSFFAKDEQGVRYETSKKSYKVDTKQLIVYDCNITSPHEAITIHDNFKAKVDEIIKKAEASTKVRTSTYALGQQALAGFNKPTTTKTVYNGKKPLWDSANFSTKKDLDKPIISRHKYVTPGGFLKNDGWEEDWGIPQGKSNIQKNVEDNATMVFEFDIEEFAMLVLNTGNPVSEYADCEDIIENYLKFGLTSSGLRKKVIDEYDKMYKKFIIDKYENTESAEVFIAVTEAIIEEYKTTIEDLVNIRGKLLVEGVVEGLESMLNNFKKEL